MRLYIVSDRTSRIRTGRGDFFHCKSSDSSNVVFVFWVCAFRFFAIPLIFASSFVCQRSYIPVKRFFLMLVQRKKLVEQLVINKVNPRIIGRKNDVGSRYGEGLALHPLDSAADIDRIATADIVYGLPVFLSDLSHPFLRFCIQVRPYRIK